MGAEYKDKCPSGIIVGGCEGGIIEVYDANKILEGEEQPLILTKNKHTGPVRALDFNSFRVSKVKLVLKFVVDIVNCRTVIGFV